LTIYHHSLMAEQPTRPRIVSGMRPTGKLHLGNYMGALRNWVRLQNETNENGEQKYDCFFFIADLHALTTDYADPSQLQQNTLDVALDWLAAGLDPLKSTIFVQSHVPAHSELFTLFSMITPLGWLERVPSYKDQQENITGKDLTTYGFLGYPLLQAADILLYGDPGVPLFVPVGADQVAHVELTREVARRFNYLYTARIGDSEFRERMAEAKREFEEALDPNAKLSAEIYVRLMWGREHGIFAEPDQLLTPAPKLPGTDGRKMSKSYGNTIGLTDRYELVLEKTRNMTNGGQRLNRRDPGNPDICPVGDLHRALSSSDVDTMIRQGCRSASIGCVDCKHLAAQSIWAELQPFQRERSAYELNLSHSWDLATSGIQKANIVAGATMGRANERMNLRKTVAGILPRITAFEQFRELRGLQYDLSSLKYLWDADPKIRGHELREYWFKFMAPPELKLRRINETQFVNFKNQRFTVRTSRDIHGNNSWYFELATKASEALVLLAWEKDTNLLHDFVIPQKVYADAMRQFKTMGNFAVDVQRGGDRFVLHIRSGTSTNITQYHSHYEPFQ
jgi:tryptophanyl-tRNA synthetase